nr:MAG TPA: hypothetical protein [Caudoviricetes sp.]
MRSLLYELLLASMKLSDTFLLRCEASNHISH